MKFVSALTMLPHTATDGFRMIHIRLRWIYRTLGSVVASFGFVLFFTATPKAMAADDMDPGMIAMLPPYCKYSAIYRDRLGTNDPAQIAYWRQLMGPGFAHIHHYCNGLLQTNTALLRARNKGKRLSLLSISIKEFDYVIGNVQENFVLLPEILSKKGQNLIRLGRGPESISVMEQAMRIKPDYWPPYAHLADYYVDIGQRSKARDVLKRGLAHAPGAEALATRLTKIGDTGAQGGK